MAIMINSFCQDASTETKILSKADYLKKSRTQKIAGWCLAGTGTGILALTILAQASEDFYYSWDSYTSYSNTNYTGYYVAGGIVLASGIVCLAASKVNSNKAHALTANFKIENSKHELKDSIGPKEHIVCKILTRNRPYSYVVRPEIVYFCRTSADT